MARTDDVLKASTKTPNLMLDFFSAQKDCRSRDLIQLKISTVDGFLP
jgi:hypothetical protein